MPKALAVDPGLFQYCTPRQSEVLQAIIDAKGHGPTSANALGVNPSTPWDTLTAVERKAARQGYHVAGGVRAKESKAAAPPPPKEVHDSGFWRKRAAALTKQVGELEHLTEQLAGVRDVPYQVPSYSLMPSSGRAQSVVLCHWSDVHMGEVIAAEEIGGINAFNSDICRQRLRRYVSAACNIGTRWADDTDCVGAYFVFGGDLISGDIHEELRMTNDLTAHEQVQAVVEEACAAIRELLRAFGRVHLSGVPGNHGRNTIKATAKLYSRLSYDMMIVAMVAREFEKDPRVTFQMSAAKDQVTPIFGRNLLMTHGDKMGTGGGQGFAGPFLPIVAAQRKFRHNTRVWESSSIRSCTATITQPGTRGTC